MLYTNRQGAGFQVTSLPYARLHPNTVTGTAAYADYDGDGLLDVLETVQARSFVTRLLHNETASAGAHWLGVRLWGGASNRDAAGAIVILRDGDRELGRRALGQGGLGTSTEIGYFGLGPHATLSGIDVRWPEGTRSTLGGTLKADHVIDVPHP